MPPSPRIASWRWVVILGALSLSLVGCSLHYVKPGISQMEADRDNFEGQRDSQQYMAPQYGGNTFVNRRLYALCPRDRLLRALERERHAGVVLLPSLLPVLGYCPTGPSCWSRRYAWLFSPPSSPVTRVPWG